VFSSIQSHISASARSHVHFIIASSEAKVAFQNPSINRPPGKSPFSTTQCQAYYQIIHEKL